LITSEIPGIVGFVCLTISGGYVWAALMAVALWRLAGISRVPMPVQHPAVTVVKPLCGAEIRLYESLRSFFVQDYREFQIVFGVRDPADPAIDVVRRLAREFPAVPIELVIDAHQHGSNRKVSNLINMLPFARHDTLVIVDSDAQVGENYLATIVAAIQQDNVGLVTCTYRSVPAGGLWSRLGAMYINDWYIPSVLLSWSFGHRGFASGQTLCLRRQTLETLGGLQPICNHLADDYELSERVRALGLKTVLSEYVTDSQHDEPTLAHLLDHEIRWMRTLRALQPREFPFLFASFGLPLAFGGLLLACSLAVLVVPSLLLFSAVVLGRLALHVAMHWDGERINLSDLWLIPARDALLMWVWWRALRTSQVSWRGHQFAVNAQGVIRPLR
jgi:ceramide glucosyltransferase